MVLGTEARPEAAHNDSKTASSLLFDFFAVEHDPGADLDAYRAERAQPLLDAGIATGANIFRLREQQVPAARLARDLNLGLGEEWQAGLWHQLDRENAGTGTPDRPLPAAVYGAAYQLASDDLGAAITALKAHGEPAEGTGRSSISTGAYTKTADYGHPSPTGDDAFQSAMIVFTHPIDIGYVDSFNDWYTNNHMIDVAKSPPYRSCSRYVLERVVAGTPLPYLAIYEIGAPYSEQVHLDMMQQVGVDPWPKREPMPTTAGGQGVLVIDFWGYFARVWQGG